MLAKLACLRHQLQAFEPAQPLLNSTKKSKRATQSLGEPTMRKLKHSRRLLRELIGFAHANKAYWLIPTVLALGLLSLLIFGGQSAAPFIYTLF